MNRDPRSTLIPDLDQRIHTLRPAEKAAVKPSLGWLRAVRNAMGRSQADVAKKLGVSKQSYAEMETAEAEDRVTLQSLHRAAAAMDCELVYFLIPRDTNAKTFAELAQDHDPSWQHPKATEHSMAARAAATDDSDSFLRAEFGGS